MGWAALQEGMGLAFGSLVRLETQESLLTGCPHFKARTAVWNREGWDSTLGGVYMATLCSYLFARGLLVAP